MAMKKKISKKGAAPGPGHPTKKKAPAAQTSSASSPTHSSGLDRKVIGRPFQAGNPGGPGRPPIPTDLRQARSMLRADFERITHRMLKMTRTELETYVRHADTPSLDVVVGTIISKAWARGDQFRLSFLLDRLIGPVPRNVAVSGPEGEPFRPFASFSADELTEAIVQLQVIIKSGEQCNSTPKPPPSSVLPALSSPQGFPTES